MAEEKGLSRSSSDRVCREQGPGAGRYVPPGPALPVMQSVTGQEYVDSNTVFSYPLLKTATTITVSVPA